MANVQKYFEQFHNTVRTDYDMNQTLRDKRDIIVNRVKKYLRDNKLPGVIEFNQGSYAVKTGTIPIGREYDIDVGLKFNLGDTEYDAKTVRKWVFDAVDGHTEKVEDRGPCIRVVYSDGYHVDLVSYANWTDDFNQEQFRLAHKTQGWRPSDPPKLIAHINSVRARFPDTEDNATKTDQFRRCVRYLRRWDDVRIPRESTAKPSGLAFILLAEKYLPRSCSWDGKSNDLAALKQFAFQAGNLFGRLTAVKPTPEYDDVLVKMTDDEMSTLKAKLKGLYSSLSSAENESDTVEACKILAKEFGDDFPIPEKEDTAKKSIGPAIITSSSSA